MGFRTLAIEKRSGEVWKLLGAVKTQFGKFGDLLEKREYRYDPVEHHGPTLYYFSLPFAWAQTGRSFASLDVVTLRLVPAIFGAGIVLLLLLLKDGFSRSAVVFSGIFAAVSPLMVFYSRFYIQETLLVFFLKFYQRFCTHFSRVFPSILLPYIF